MEERYLLLEEIGNGAGGTVYKAFDRHLNRCVAVKRVCPDKIRAAEEAEVLKHLKHPAIPIIYDVYGDEEYTCIVMEYMSGRSLISVLDEGEPFFEGRAVEIGLRIGECLQYLHELPEKIIYRDLKPANLLLDEGDAVKLIDFDSAFTKQPGTLEKVRSGTFGYSAPEQFEAEGIVDERSDIYGFGTTMYHMLTGQNPSRPPYRFRKIRECNPLISEELERIIETCMAKEREARFGSMGEVLAELKGYDKNGKRKRKRGRTYGIGRRRYMTETKKNILLTAKREGGLFFSAVLLLGGLLAAGLLLAEPRAVNAENISSGTKKNWKTDNSATGGGQSKAGDTVQEPEILPLILYNNKKETIIIKEGTFYKTDTNFHLAIPNELFSGEKGAEITIICKDLESGKISEKVLLLKSK